MTTPIHWEGRKTPTNEGFPLDESQKTSETSAVPAENRKTFEDETEGKREESAKTDENPANSA